MVIAMICFACFLMWFLKQFSQQSWSATITRTLFKSAAGVFRFFIIFFVIDIVFATGTCCRC